jgi:hypothetical protein
MPRPSISYATRSDSTEQAEIATLANILRLVLESANTKVAGTTNSNGSSVECTEEVGDVDRQPD